MTHLSDRARTFLVVIDESPEELAALKYAAYRAVAVGGKVALLYVTEPHEIYLWAGLESQIEEQETSAALKALEIREKLVEDMTGQKPICFIRHGSRREALLALIEEEPSVSLLVLAASPEAEGPGPLLTYLTSPKGIKQLKIPLIVVPEGYDDKGDRSLISSDM